MWTVPTRVIVAATADGSSSSTLSSANSFCKVWFLRFCFCFCFFFFCFGFGFIFYFLLFGGREVVVFGTGVDLGCPVIEKTTWDFVNYGVFVFGRFIKNLILWEIFLRVFFFFFW
jgi:hypothetical protein